jgi:beta-mannosidase
MCDELIQDWTIEPLDAEAAARTDGPVSARVPGGVHADLIAAGLIDDLTVRGRDVDQLWVADTPWRYRTTLRRPSGPYERAVLVFEGIATLGRVSVDGRERLRTSDMFRRHELDVTADLAKGSPLEVTVDLEPVLPTALARDAAGPLPRPGEYWRPFNQIRTMACAFGWDWGPVTMDAALWRPVRLRTWLGARLTDVRVVAEPAGPGTGDCPAVTVEIRAEGRPSAVQVLVTGPGESGRIAVEGSAVMDGDHARLQVPVPGALTWWPRTEGDQPLYQVTVQLLGNGHGMVDQRRVRVGFRTVEVEQRPDAAGTGFALHVNGQRVWVRGLDWIPADPFPGRVTPDRYRDQLAQAAAAGANAVRVWGGGIYEHDAFYDICDELGLLVIQDFLFACAAYPEDDATVADVRAEVTDNVRRLRHHASLAMWCGNNENLWGHADWRWQEVLHGRPWGLRYYQEILPELLAELDGTRPYVPGSPFSPDAPAGAPARHPNDPAHGMQHIWDVWNQLDYIHYESWRPRFVSEFGWQAPASWPTLVAAVGEPIDPDRAELGHHQRAADGTAKLHAGLAAHYPDPPRSGVRWYLATQLLQARAVATGVTHLRSLHDHCSGAVWWQLNDLWPAISWSVIDVRGRRKLSWYALRAAFDPRLVTLTASPSGAKDERDGHGGGLHAVLVNDTSTPWSEHLVVRVADEDTTDVVLEADVQVEPHGSVSLPLVVPPGPWLLAVADVGGRRATRWLHPDLDLPAVPEHADVHVARPDRHRVEVTVTAHALLRDVCLAAELLVPDAVVEGHPATLLPGESVTFRVDLPAADHAGLDHAELADDDPDDTDWAELVWSDNRLRAGAWVAVKPGQSLRA